MTDEDTETRMQPGGFDDDRLLALALGLDDDPELLAAAEGDAELAGRLEAMRADVALIGAQIGLAVPAPDHGYTGLSGDRWGGLKEFFEPPASAAKPRRGRRWWRIAAPVMALVALALIVGVVAVDRSGTGSSATTSAEVARTAADGAAQPAASAQNLGAATESTTGERIAEQLDRFAVIVIARARQATGALQRFAVLRVFKGDAPQVVELQVDDRPADTGRLHLLMLDPVTTTAGQSASPEPFTAPEPVPSPGAAKDGQGLPGVPLAVAYKYGGEPTMVRELDAGTDPDSVSLPIP